MKPQVEIIPFKSMDHKEDGLYSVENVIAVFTAFTSKDIENEIVKRYTGKAFPVGNMSRQKEDNGSDLKMQWSWGFFRRTQNINTFKECIANKHEVFDSEAFGPAGMTNYYEGSIQNAKLVFSALENNKDVRLFIKFSVAEQKKM